MPYEVLKDGLTVLKANAEYKNDAGRVIGYDHTSVMYDEGDVIPGDDVSPVVVEAYEEGDEHTRSVLKRIGRVRKAKVADEPDEAVDSDKE